MAVVAAMHSKEDRHCSQGKYHMEHRLDSQGIPDRVELLVMDILALDMAHIPVVGVDSQVLVVNGHIPVVVGVDKVCKQAGTVAHLTDEQAANQLHVHGKGFAGWRTVVLEQLPELQEEERQPTVAVYLRRLASIVLPIAQISCEGCLGWDFAMVLYIQSSLVYCLFIKHTAIYYFWEEESCLAFY